MLLQVQESPLKDLQWNNRIILINGHNSIAVTQLANLSLHQTELLDRELIILLIAEDSVNLGGKFADQYSSSAIRKWFRIPQEEFMLLLVGKDGTIKIRSDTLLQPFTIFHSIDQMPMRKRELNIKY
ncbi:MAG: DUF4174 domain-containing protein [Saprospiraceae bacterium]|nr:DUF4174 domain-containing protein [Saprospiraceae bacterium]